jgi:Transposase DDE domain
MQPGGRQTHAHQAAAGRPRRLHRRRLHHRRPGRHRYLPGWARRPGPPARRRHPPGPVQGPVRRLPAAPALHHLQNRAGTQRPPQHALLAAARRDAARPAWKDEYRRWRPPVERAIAWLVARGSRRVPYRGITADNAWLANRAAALNLRRLVNLGLTDCQSQAEQKHQDLQQASTRGGVTQASSPASFPEGASRAACSTSR